MKLFVGNLSSDTQDDELRELFEQYGEVTEASALTGFGFVVRPTDDLWDS